MSLRRGIKTALAVITVVIFALWPQRYVMINSLRLSASA
jgi:hypothetical protein